MTPEVPQEDRLGKVYGLSFSDIFSHQLDYELKRQFKENNKAKIDAFNLTSVVNYLIKITFNDYMLDDNYIEDAKQKLAEVLSKSDSPDKVSLVSSICSGLRIERTVKFGRSKDFINPLLRPINSTIRDLDKMVSNYFGTAYNDHTKRLLFEDSISNVIVYNYISNYNDLTFFGDNKDLYESPFYKLIFYVQMNDEFDINENYITLPVLVFPALKKMATVMLSYSNKAEKIEDDLQVLFITTPYDNYISIEQNINALIINSMELFFMHNPYYQTKVINGIYLDKYNISFGNMIYNKICNYMRPSMASRQLLVTKDGNYWLDRLSDLKRVFNRDNKFRGSNFYNKIKNASPKEEIEFNTAYYSWIDKFYMESNLPSINLFFSELNSEIGAFNIAIPLYTYTNN